MNAGRDVPPEVAAVLDATGLGGVLPIYATAEKAMAAV